jgi:hypothetical protein
MAQSRGSGWQSGGGMLKKLVGLFRGSAKRAKTDAGGKTIRFSLPEEQIRDMMKGKRDFKVRIGIDGTVSAYCMACECAILVKESDGLLWYICPRCGRRSFDPMGNIYRDIRFAGKDGKLLEYQLFYLNQLPSGLKPPG